MRQAVDQLLRRLDARLTAEQEAAAARLRSCAGGNITWELLVKTFNDLDAVVFGGDLFHRVYISWVNMCVIGEGSGQLGLTVPPKNYESCRIRICISSDMDWRKVPRFYALGVLLHEMVHAYFIIWYRENELDPGKEHAENPGHGPTFMKAAKRIERYMGTDLTSNPEKWLGRMQGRIGRPDMMGMMGVMRMPMSAPGLCGMNASPKELGRRGRGAHDMQPYGGFGTYW